MTTRDKALIAGALIVALALVARGFLGAESAPGDEVAALAVEPAPAPAAASGSEERRTIAVFERAAPSVVYIASREYQRRFYFGRPRNEVRAGAGTGVLWDADGHVLTNYHVVRDADALEVTLHDGSQRDAELVGASPEYDLAVLRVELGDFRPNLLPIGSSADLRVGAKALAIGNPFGLDASLSVGVVSALGRELPSLNYDVRIRNAIQTDAAINPGNSGGPLLDSSGRLIGLNVQIYSPSGANAGIGFAIPIDTIVRVAPKLIEHGSLRPGVLGIEFRSEAWNRAVRRRWGIDSGVPVVRAAPGLPAAAAGIQGVRERGSRIIPGDVIVELGAQPVADVEDLLRLLENYLPGDRVNVRTLRDGRRRSYDIVLAGR